MLELSVVSNMQHSFFVKPDVSSFSVYKDEVFIPSNVH